MNAQEILILIALLEQYGLPLVQKWLNVVAGTKRLVGETDDQFITRLNALTDSTLDDAEKGTKAVVDDTKKG